MENLYVPYVKKFVEEDTFICDRAQIWNQARSVSQNEKVRPKKEFQIRQMNVGD